MVAAAQAGEGGGYLGVLTAYPFAVYLGPVAAPILLVALWLVGLMLTFDLPLYRVYEWVLGKVQAYREAVEARREEAATGEGESDPVDKDGDQEESGEDLGNNIKSIQFVEGPSEDPVEESKSVSAGSGGNASASQSVARRNIYEGIDWELPPLDLLEENEKKPKQVNLEERAEIIKQTLHNFNIEVEFAGANVGPTVTQYTFKPAIGVKLSRILALQDNLALALAAHPLRIEAPIPGKSLIGVEVPNKTKAMVRMKSMLESHEFQTRPSNLCLAFGEDVNGNVVIGNIEKMPHMMIAGATGTGKSVCINSILTSLLYQNSPEQLRLILVDPKRVELSMFNGIPHLLTPVIVENSKVVNALKWAVSEMERRYKLLQEIGSRDIHSYNEQISQGKKRKVTKANGESVQEEYEKIPFILIMIDELADLMVAHAKEVEVLIVRLAQMARAVGIHLIVSTQRPSVEVLTGLIKANITTRIAFQVASQIDSRTILDMGGAEKLLGNGDMLYLSAAAPQPIRLQGVYISEKEVKAVVKHIKKQAEEVEFEDNEDLSGSLEEQLDSAMGALAGPGTEGESDDVMYEKAKQTVIETGRASTSLLQRRLRIGYSRAARLIDLLEEHGVVGPSEGSKPRAILMRGDVSYESPEEDQLQREKWNA